MPDFPHSKYSTGQSTGAFVRAQGSHSPSLEIDLPQPEGILHPFKITTRNDNGTLRVKVRAGTVNNLVPEISGDRLDKVPAPELTISGDYTHHIYVKAEMTATPVFFPDTLTVISTTSAQTDADEDGYLLLGTVVISGGKIVGVNQYVYASQVVVRAKPGSDTAIYLWTSR